MEKNYYNILGVSKHASDDEIKKAYKKMALNYHPDKNNEPGTEERFRDIAEAYEILSDPDRKSNFDRYGDEHFHRGRSRRNRRKPDETFARNVHFYPSDPLDLFRAFFGRQDPFCFPFADMFPQRNQSSHPRNLEGIFKEQEIFPGSSAHVSTFDDLPGGSSSSATTFMTGDGGTVHITRTVIGEDGSVRREMRFRTPSASREEDRGKEDKKKTDRRQESQQPPSGRQRMTSRTTQQRDRRGETNVSPFRKCHQSGERMRSQESTSSNNSSGQGISVLNPKRSVNQRQEPTNHRAMSESLSSRPRKRERSHVRQREPSMMRESSLMREPETRDRSCSANRIEGVNSSLNSIHCSVCDKEFARFLIEDHASTCPGLKPA